MVVGLSELSIKSVKKATDHSSVIRRFFDTLDTQLFLPKALKFLSETKMPVNDNAGSSAYVISSARRGAGRLRRWTVT